MYRKQLTEVLVNILLVIALLAPRVVDLVKFTAADEPFWLAVGANYYYALTHHDFKNTVYEYHPAVTTMWIVTGAMLIYFPEYRGLMNGYFVQEKSSFDEYLVAHGKNPLDLLWWSRFLQVLVNVTLFVVVFFLLGYIIDKRKAAAVLFLASFSPYLFGQSRLLNHESMVGLFSMISVLAMIIYLFEDRRLFLLILSASAAAFANLTKSSAIVVLPVVVVIILVWFFAQNRVQHLSVASLVAVFFSWLGILILVYVVSWPGMWVAPGKMLYEVYGNAFSYAFQGARLSVTHGLKPSNFSFASAGSSLIKILTSILWRTTPITWLGIFFSIVVMFIKDLKVISLLAKHMIGFLFLEALACIGMFAVIQGRDQPHYVMTAYYGVEFASALGWVFIFRWLGNSYAWIKRPLVQTALFLMIFCIQAGGLLYTYPYFYTYLNPVMLASSPAPVFFYGERMEVAAAYLAAKPDSQDSTSLVYFGRTFEYYFPGKTMVFKPLMFEDKSLLIEYLQKSDYLVVYSGLYERLPLLKEITPEKVFDLNGRPYVEIYRVSDIPVSFFTR